VATGDSRFMPFVLDPQVAGELGARTEIDTSVHPPVVTCLEYVLDRPGTDDLIQSFPVFLATSPLKSALDAAGMRGITWREAAISHGDFYDEVSGGDSVSYLWLVPGEPGDDCWIEEMMLVVSDRMMDVLRSACLDDCVVTERP
jgi:hypothetical protein